MSREPLVLNTVMGGVPQANGPSPAQRVRQLAWSRWSALAVAAVVASSIVLLGVALLRSAVTRFAAVPTWALVPASLVFAAACVRHARGRWLAFAGLRQISTYPPIWLAGVAGTTLFIFVVAGLPSIRESVGLSFEHSAPLGRVGMAGAAAVVGTILLAGGQWAWRARASRRTSSAIGPPPSASPAWLYGSFEHLTSWLSDDAPITGEEGDAFGHAQIANRIASRLLDARPPSQAVVGSLGAGKTTLRALVVGALKATGPAARHVRLVPVELWPYEKPSAAVEGVIRALIDAVAEEANVVALRGIPESYVKAMSSAGGVWSAVTHLQGTPTSPFDTLRRIDAVATAIGRRYVVWVEDLERFAGRGGRWEKETPEDAERLNPIRALLHGLDRLESVSVVTATTSLHVRFDLEKIARFVEELPRLNEHEVARVIAIFRDGCRQQFDVIDPADPTVRKALDGLGDQQRLEIRRAFLGAGVHSLQDSLPALCSTPRSLKQALRSALDIWKRLPGEIDFDDVLVMSILREAEPDVFALVRQHIDGLRRLEGRRADRKGWDAVFAEMPLDERMRDAVNQAVNFVFSEHSAELKPQGILNSRHTDYWERFLAVPALSGGERDQPVLRTILEQDDEAVLRLLEDPRRSDALESFSRLMTTDRLRRLIVPLLKRRSTENPSGWAEGNPPGMIPLWRMWLRRSERGELAPGDVLDEVRRALDVVVPANLFLAARVEQYFVSQSGDVHDMLRDGNISRANEAKTHLRRLAVATYSGKPEALADALVGAHPPTLLWVCWGLDSVRANAMSGEPFPSWADLAATILQAARLRPAEVIPQLACLVSRESTVFARRGNLAQRYEFDRDLAQNLFGSADVVLDAFEHLDQSEWAGLGPVQSVFAALEERRAS